VATVSPEQQIANVEACLRQAFARVWEYHGLTMQQARRLVHEAQTHRHGHRWLCRNMGRVSDCWAAVAALDHWRQLKDQHRAGLLRAVEVNDESPF
jgi:hypothetical protein